MEGSWHELCQKNVQLHNCAISSGLWYEDEIDRLHVRNCAIAAQIELT